MRAKMPNSFGGLESADMFPLGLPVNDQQPMDHSFGAIATKAGLQHLRGMGSTVSISSNGTKSDDLTNLANCQSQVLR